MGQRYGEDFKREAVRLGSPCFEQRTDAEADLGMGFSTLNKWVEQSRHDDLASRPYEDQAKEISRLRKENRILREEREILKKAAVFFASQK